MRKIRKEHVLDPFISSTGERVCEMIGHGDKLGNAVKHSFGHAVIPKGATNALHYHSEAEETYYILRGQAKMLVDEIEFELNVGDAMPIKPLKNIKIFKSEKRILSF